jgi:hypothetical protein
MKKIIIVLIILVALGGGYYWYTQQTPTIDTNTPTGEQTDSGEKLNIKVVCESALTYMTFPDGESADRFVAECEAGEHPDVIERYKAEMDYGDGAAI